jgi:hypothetical protein
MVDDDLSAWNDDPLVRALTSPATADELAGEQSALSAFRAARPTGARRRLAGRLGIGGSALAVAIAFSGGAAAAYTAALPASIQQAVHDVAGWAAVPAPAHHTTHRSAGQQHVVTPVSPPVAVPDPFPTSTEGTTVPSHTGTTAPVRPTPGAKGAHSSHPAPPSPPAATTPSASPSPTASQPTSPSPTPTPTPTSTPTPVVSPPPVPVVTGSITITPDATRVPAGGEVSVTGRLADPVGNPVVGRTVWLVEQVPGQSGAVELAGGQTDANGMVQLGTPPLSRDVRLRLVAGHRVRSAPVHIVVVPTVTANVVVQGWAYSVAVTTTGAQPGDVVVVEQRTAIGWTQVGTATLDSTGAAEIGLSPPSKGTNHYRLILVATSSHARATVRFVEPLP